MPEGTAGIAVEIYLYTAYYYGKIRIKKKEVIIMIPNRHISNLKVSAKYSCGFPDPQVLPIIVVERYLDYFTTIMEDRLWQVLAKPGFRWRNRSGLSINAARAA